MKVPRQTSQMGQSKQASVERGVISTATNPAMKRPTPKKNRSHARSPLDTVLFYSTSTVLAPTRPNA